MYEVLIPSYIRKSVKKLPQKHQILIYNALLDLKESPYLGKKLNRDLLKYYSYRVKEYRIIYKIKERDKLVLILRIGHRSSVYN